MDGVKVKEIQYKRSGARGFPVLLPLVWVRDVGLKTGDTIEIRRTPDDRLYIEKVSRNPT